MKKSSVLYFAISMVSLLAGVFIYYISAENPSSLTLTFLRNYGSDFCWLFAFVFSLYPFINGVFRKSVFITANLCLICGIAFEALQRVGLINGTGDFWDIVSYLLATLSSCLLIKIINKKEKNYEKNY